MPTPLDNAMRSKGAFFAFTGMVAGAALWAIWGGDIFPAQEDPKGEPESWTEEEMRTWLRLRKLHPHHSASREQLLERINANLRIPRQR